MTGFKEFLMRGYLIELAVAFIMGTVFAAVVKAFTDLVMGLLGLIVDVQGLDQKVWLGIQVGPFLSALVTFVLTALVLYFAVVLPYNRVSRLRKAEEPEVAASSEDLLAEIRDLLKSSRGAGPA